MDQFHYETIHIRHTRPGERILKSDKFLAWFQGDAAGAMADTAEKAIVKALNGRNFEPKED